MRLNLEAPIVFFDLETTSKDVKTARIVSISLIKLHPGGRREKLKRLVNPTIPIPADAEAIHKISDEMVKDQPTFAQIAKSLHSIVNDQVLGGFNLLMYDIPLLSIEFDRAGILWPTAEQKLTVIDAGNIFKQMHPRTLTAAFKLYCNGDLEGAHDAEVDNDATIDVLMAQLEAHPELSSDVNELAESSKMVKNAVDINGFFVMTEDGEYAYNMGKKKGELVKSDKGSFISWMLQQDFSSNTKAHGRKILDELSNN